MAKPLSPSMKRMLYDPPRGNVMGCLSYRDNRTLDALRDRGLLWVDPRWWAGEPFYEVRRTEEGNRVSEADDA